MFQGEKKKPKQKNLRLSLCTLNKKVKTKGKNPKFSISLSQTRQSCFLRQKKSLSLCPGLCNSVYTYSSLGSWPAARFVFFQRLSLWLRAVRWGALMGAVLLRVVQISSLFTCTVAFEYFWMGLLLPSVPHHFSHRFSSSSSSSSSSSWSSSQPLHARSALPISLARSYSASRLSLCCCRVTGRSGSHWLLTLSSTDACSRLSRAFRRLRVHHTHTITQNTQSAQKTTHSTGTR